MNKLYSASQGVRRLNPKIYETLEFNKIRQAVHGYSQTEMGQRFIMKMKPSSDYETVLNWQEETAEAFSLLVEGKTVPIPHLERLDMAMKRLEVGASLNGLELAGIGKLLSSSRQVVTFFENMQENDEAFPALQAWSDQLVSLPQIEKRIEQTVDEGGTVLSSASKELASIRRRQVQAEDQIRSHLNQLLRSKAKYLSDAIITFRNDRYVLPVKAEYRSTMKGTLHDQSATGQTLYIEPQAIVNLNNRRSQLQVEERREIERIFEEISGELMPYHEDIKLNEALMGTLDFIQARAKYAKAIEATRPRFSTDNYIALWQARHPLIAAQEVVSNDILLGENYQSLIITGPNTGGKTILLKTLGLLQLMGQAGLQIPAEENSQLGLFDDIFAYIGDEQSIEQSLSTFSSHMTNIVSMLEQATAHSLLLFDELGSGTDPQEGAALAMAILDYTRKLGSTVMATTHYPELKLYAHNAKNTINASMEFDSDTLQPTFRLLIGIPGRSNALEISKNLGLPESILQQAREGVSPDSQSMNEMVAKLEHDRRQVERLEEEVQSDLDYAQRLVEDLEIEYGRWQREKETIREKAKTQANQEVENIRQQAEKVLQEIRTLQLEQGQATIKEHELIDKRTALSQLKQQETLKKNKVLKRAKKAQKLQVGDDVEVLTYGQRGTIIEEISPKEYLVQMGIMKMNIGASDLKPIDKTPQKKRVNVQRQARSKVKTSLDLRGQRYEEAMRNLKQYLDGALLSNHPMVTIIHGRGTGAIREGVQKVLRSHSQVDRFNYSAPNAGGDGSTEVYFK